ncbi:Diguanylate cyclase/phosphodiesterase domain 1 (GGDEF) [hydrothermal vent metagenome]|uniref:Diguanylate cyclase/phosphodiesterase domain 1 (GGDEF) n=1 Tax=hydrothermal vent metagenome TaxID=652676 RepID=A0A1W1CL35_9ZZZZ
MSTILDLAINIANMQKDFIVVFENNVIVLTNDAFNKFFGVSSTEQYNRDFGDFLNNFVPHPSYFNAQNINTDETWVESILQLDEIDRVVSFLSQTYEPHAFSVSINSNVQNMQIVTFEDITQSLIKRIMIENNTSIDKKTGAYTKQYFLQINKSYEEAAIFNEKIIGLALVDISENYINHEDTKAFVLNFKKFIRQDDMLVKWSDTKLLLAYLVDDTQKAELVTIKLQKILKDFSTADFRYKLKTIHQKNAEKINTLISTLLDT